jgi:serine/threonine protein kinase
MDFLPGGELFLHLKKRGLIMEHEVQFYLGEMIIAIDFLHGLGIIHRDLKPENVLLRRDAHVCITDFGLGKFFVAFFICPLWCVLSSISQYRTGLSRLFRPMFSLRR